MKPKRLAMLLGLRADPHAKDICGMKACLDLAPRQRQAWLDVCNSFTACNSVLAILDQIEAETATEQRLNPASTDARMS